MALKSSVMLPLGTKAPDFVMPDPEGRKYSLKDFNGAPALLVIFMCNHCPYVKHVRQELAVLVKEFQAKGVAVAGINPNDIEAYPEDAPDKMKEEAQTFGYTFPYLFDATQAVAKAYHAVCTPDFFLFDKEQKLVYRGQMDSSRPGNQIPVTGRDLRAALDAVLAGRSPDPLQTPSAGCSIKWKPGGEPEWM